MNSRGCYSGTNWTILIHGFGFLFLWGKYLLIFAHSFHYCIIKWKFCSFLRLAEYYNRQAEGENESQMDEKKNTGKTRTAADSVKKWFLKQTHEGKKNNQPSTLWAIVSSTITQNSLSRWKNPPNFASEKYSILSLSSLTIKLTKKNGGKILL